MKISFKKLNMVFSHLRQNSSEIFKFAKYFSGLCFGIFFALYIYIHREELLALFEIDLLDILLLLFALSLSDVLSAIKFAILYKALGVNMSVLESFSLSKVATALNIILPAQAGGVARSIYLKRRYALPYSQIPVIYIGSLIILLSMGTLVAFLLNSVNYYIGNTVPLLLWVVVLVSSVSIAGLWINIPEWLLEKNLGKIGDILLAFSKGLENLQKNKESLWKLFVNQLISFVLGGLSIAIAYRSLGGQINILVGITIVVYTAFLNLIVFTPGNLGIKEVLFGYLSEVSGYSFAQGVAASMLIRAVGLVITYSIAPFAWYFLFYRKNISVRRKVEDSE